jgi:hypothetical protein
MISLNINYRTWCTYIKLQLLQKETKYQCLMTPTCNTWYETGVLFDTSVNDVTDEPHRGSCFISVNAISAVDLYL